MQKFTLVAGRSLLRRVSLKTLGLRQEGICFLQ